LAHHELSEDLYANVANWQTHPGFTDAERIALEYTEKFATDHHKLDGPFFERMHEHWSDEEIVEISICVGTWMSMGRVVRVLGAEVACALPIQVNDVEDEKTP
jgi:alkylhydroperoxidase family enzyme